MTKMTSNRPYLIRALYDWIVDNNLTPYVLVNAEYEGTQVPKEFVKDGHIVLNISPTACQGLHIHNDRIIFSARFAGVAIQVCLPPMSVMAIYARENGRGMVFNANEDDGEGSESDTGGTTQAASGETQTSGGDKRRPKLTVIK